MGEEGNLGSREGTQEEPHSWAQITKPNFDSNQATIDVCESRGSGLPAGVLSDFREVCQGLSRVLASGCKSRKHL